MNIGVLVVNNRPWATADTIVSFGTRAEALGFDSLWVADQVVIPSKLEPSYPYGRTQHYDIEGNRNFFEALTVLTYLARRTSRVQLGTSVLVVPYRQPLLVAKQWATLDAFSGGKRSWASARASCASSSRLWAWTRSTDAARPPMRRSASSGRSGHRVPRSRSRARCTASRRCGSCRSRSDRAGRRSGSAATGVATLHELLGRAGRQPTDVVVSAKFRVYARRTGPRGEPHESELTGSAEMMAAKLRSYQAAGLQDMVVDPTPHDTSAAALEAIEFFAHEVRPLHG
jgi:alkanesulfonate monooxygenase SsuD/methylene tetrahydromethanopterin reductase-like flavin-dependent oxidoreductase (luciferase family)